MCTQILLASSFFCFLAHFAAPQNNDVESCGCGLLIRLPGLVLAFYPCTLPLTPFPVAFSVCFFCVAPWCVPCAVCAVCAVSRRTTNLWTRTPPSPRRASPSAPRNGPSMRCVRWRIDREWDGGDGVGVCARGVPRSMIKLLAHALPSCSAVLRCTTPLSPFSPCSLPPPPPPKSLSTLVPGVRRAHREDEGGGLRGVVL